MHSYLRALHLRKPAGRQAGLRGILLPSTFAFNKNEMKRLLLYIFFTWLLFVSIDANAQRFADEIATFKKADSVSYPFQNQHPIVFTGSSSFRKWENIQSYFPGYPILNRGFGGSTLPDMIFYANEIIIKYVPRQVIIYCGENDLASSDSITAKIVLQRFKQLFSLLRQDLPNASIAFVSIKPSPSRQKIQPQVIEANRLIRKFLKHKSGTAYIDIYKAMLNKDGTMRQELFIADNLHMNEKGYTIWQKIIEPYLLR
jgi:lysophospholipase L1-like esterase